MHKSLVILMLLSVGCAHATAAESDALRLYPLTTKERGECFFQLKGTKDPKTKHFIQRGVCVSYSKDIPLDVGDCTAISVININKNQIILHQKSLGIYSPTLYKNNDYVVEMEFKERDCDNEKISCTPFYLDAVLTVKKGSQEQSFDMLGECIHIN